MENTYLKIWNSLSNILADDGAALDICLYDLELDQIKKLFQYFTENYRFDLFIKMEKQKELAVTTFPYYKGEATILTLKLDSISIDCTLFDPNGLEFYFMPSNKTNPKDISTVFSLFSSISKIVNRDILFKYEGFKIPGIIFKPRLNSVFINIELMNEIEKLDNHN